MIDSHRHCLHEIPHSFETAEAHFAGAAESANPMDSLKNNAHRAHRAVRKLRGPWEIDTEPDYGNSAAQMMSRLRS